MAAQLEVMPAATGAFSKTLDNLGLIFQLGVAPFGALFIWYLIVGLFGGTLGSLLAQIGVGVATALLAAPLFRHYLLKETPRSESIAFNFGDREKNVAMVYVGYALIGWVPTLLALNGNGILALIASLALLYFVVRLILLPARVALDNPIDLGAAYAKTDGHFFQIFLAILLVGILLAIIFVLLSLIGIVGTAGMVPGGIIQSFFTAVLQLFTSAVSIAFIANVYEALVPAGNPAPEVIEAPATPTPPDPEPNSDDKPSTDT